MDSTWVTALRVVWWATAVGAVVLAAAFATRLPETSGAFGFGVATGLVAAIASLLVSGDTDVPLGARVRRAALRAVATTVGTATILVLALAVGPAVLVPLTAAGLLCPPVLRRLELRVPEGRAAPPCETTDEESARLSMHLVRKRLATLELSDVDHLWQRTAVRLRTEGDEREIGWLVLLRQLLIDELERRDPQALRRWLDSDPHVGGDPTVHFRREEPPGSVAS